jgi:hypothetical protein
VRPAPASAAAAAAALVVLALALAFALALLLRRRRRRVLCALPFLVGSLRSLFNSPTAFAAIVQLAPWASSNASFNGQVAALRQAQLAASDALPHMATITAVDGGDPFGPIGSIHPRAKQLVGRRLAAAALTAVHGRPTPFAGPRYASAVPGGGAAGALSATVSFAAPSAASPGNDGPLRLISPSPDGPFANSSVCPTGVAADLCAGFALRGSDNVWYAAVAALGAAPRRARSSSPRRLPTCPQGSPPRPPPAA